jgi:hypothetical protein
MQGEEVPAVVVPPGIADCLPQSLDIPEGGSNRSCNGSVDRESNNSGERATDTGNRDVARRLKYEATLLLFLVLADNPIRSRR